VVHEGDEPGVVADMSHPDVMSRKDVTDINLAAVKADPAAMRDPERRIAERLRQVPEAAIDTRRPRVERGGHLHAEGSMAVLIERGEMHVWPGSNNRSLSSA
jgi:hypothetical protein